ncbi:MAG: tRNA lysidine(34) synthetase TilS [Nitrospirae bacterium]|nr:tRNA lysidine(34) synthetase TilS [Nitrospirota bacterium]MBU6480261.1 tRNA lysidine(34) synthetase TilS [Nitrospirota bacterium]
MAVETTIKRPSSRSVARPALLTHLVRTVRQQQLFVPGQHLLVAVSGGPDSVALLSLLHRLARSWRLTLTAVHCNFGLRGAESDGDESFVSTFCRERHLPLVIHRPTLVKRRQRSSLQAAARDARYDFMRQLAHDVGADRIVVGHTANDQAETVLMWMLRGAGMAGLAGMPYAREDRIIRPLLAATREEVVTYLGHEGLIYRRDSSNEKPLYHRNRIRKELLPVIMRLAPAAVRVLQRQADLLREDEQYLEQSTKNLMRALVSPDSRGVQRVNRQAFIGLPVALQRRLVRAILRTYDEEARASSVRVVESVRRVFLKGRSESRLSLTQTLVTLDQESVRFSPTIEKDHRDEADSAQGKREVLPLPVPSTIYWARTNQQIHVQLMTRRAAEEVGRAPSQGPVLFDADRFSEPLLVRGWQPGDRFFPHGMKGKSKKLQDFFTDRKVARHEREKVPLLVAPEGILWVVGMRQDERFVVRGGTTRCLVVSVSNRVSEKE